MSDAREFDLRFSNIPIINIRIEYQRYLNYFQSGGLLRDLSHEPSHLITPYMIWRTFPEMFLTIVLQRTLSGLEAYLAHAVHFELSARGRATPGTPKEIEASIVRAKGGAASGLFNAAPALIEKPLAMQTSNQRLWETTKSFYKSVRNPVFHGQQLEATSIRTFQPVYEHIGSIYDWIDGWHDPEQELPGFYEMLGHPRPCLCLTSA